MCCPNPDIKSEEHRLIVSSKSSGITFYDFFSQVWMTTQEAKSFPDNTMSDIWNPEIFLKKANIIMQWKKVVRRNLIKKKEDN